MTPHELSLIEQGLARAYRGRLIPVMRGGSDADEPTVLFAEVPEDLATLSDDELNGLVDAYEARVQEIADDHTAFVTDDRTVAQLLDDVSAAVETLEVLREEAAARVAAAAETLDPEDAAAAFGELASRARSDDDDPDDPEDGGGDDPADPEPEAAAETVTASAEKPAALVIPRPRTAPAALESRREMVSLCASSGVTGMDLGAPFSTPEEIADQMIKRRRMFGFEIPDGVSGEKFPIARADWKSLYPPERTLSMDPVENMGLVAAALDPDEIKDRLRQRRTDQQNRPNDASLVASGGLCAPVTPYYNLQMISVANRPVRAALPAFNADRGGIRYARPAALSAIDTAVGTKTVSQDAAGGTFAQKTCQVIPCPEIDEVDIEIIYHCLQFGNVASRTFPELLAQWNNLVLAKHARVAEALLLTGIAAASTAVTATDIGLGATSALLGQVLAAADGLRSRHRMDPDAVLRLVMPFWAIDLMVSDVIRGQFQRFDTDAAKLTALLRSFNVEPTFHIDSASTGTGQVFASQGAGALLGFPSDVVWYLFPEGSFLYIDGGVLELGIVRDSVLNKTNDFQIFGESFENVAFIGVESLQVTSTVCDSGAVSAPADVTECGDYGVS